MDWAQTLLQSLKENDVRFVAYVPDKVLVPLIDGVESDKHFTPLTATREEEAIGVACGASMGGMRGAVMMQSSGFGNSVNALASLAVPYQIPVLLIISERGGLGEFNAVQVQIARTLRPTMDALNIMHHTLTRADEVAALVGKAAAQCYRTHWPAALILSALMTGGKEG